MQLPFDRAAAVGGVQELANTHGGDGPTKQIALCLCDRAVAGNALQLLVIRRPTRVET